jgi:hypothetical protein
MERLYFLCTKNLKSTVKTLVIFKLPLHIYGMLPEDGLTHRPERVGAELFHADRQMDMSKPIVAFHNSANVPKKGLCLTANTCVCK